MQALITMMRSDVVSTLKNIKPPVAKKYGLTTLALLGSYSRNEQGLTVIDLLIDFDKIDVHNFFNCAFELEDLLKGKKVQLLQKRALGLSITK